jgi:succinate dehydrogenase / fumarate reductase, cytochrome b subunit
MTAAAPAATLQAFIWRRIHSLMGLWLVLFLIEHLLTNSQAALWLGENGQGFVNMVNALHNLPYLEVIEITLLGVPLLIHMLWGIKYLFTSKFNSSRTDGSAPHLPLGRNRAYTWQRITSWILLLGIIGHVTKFRFLEYPLKVHVDDETVYLVKVSMDAGLYTVADRLDVDLYDAAAIQGERAELDASDHEKVFLDAAKRIQRQEIDLWTGPVPQEYSDRKALLLGSAQKYQAKVTFVQALEKTQLSDGQVIACAPDFGTASLLAVRNTFKNPIYIGLYTIFVLAACFHACNGFWTFLITWGWILKIAAQRAWVTVSIVLMLILLFLGLAAVWGTYWINLRV